MAMARRTPWASMSAQPSKSVTVIAAFCARTEVPLVKETCDWTLPPSSARDQIWPTKAVIFVPA